MVPAKDCKECELVHDSEHQNQHRNLLKIGRVIQLDQKLGQSNVTMLPSHHNPDLAVLLSCYCYTHHGGGHRVNQLDANIIGIV